MEKIVVIDWADSVRASDWTFIEDVDEKPVDCISVGFLLKETDEHITIAQNYGLKPEQVCNLITIPKCSIRNIRELASQNEWKPNEEQLDVLEKVINREDTGFSGYRNEILTSLYDELKQLKNLKEK